MRIVDLTLMLAVFLSIGGCGKHIAKTKPKEQVQLVAETFSPIEQVEQALTTGDLLSLQALVEEGFDISYRFEGGVTLLMRSAELGQIEILKWLLLKGLDPEAFDARGKTAADWTTDETIKTLLGGGAGDKLIKAALEGQAEAFKDALKAGADVNFQDQEGWSALMYIVKNRTLELLAIYRQLENVNYNLRNSAGETALKIAIDAAVLAGKDPERDSFVKFIRRSGGVE